MLNPKPRRAATNPSAPGRQAAGQAFERAVRHHLEGDLEGAEREYRRTLDLAPEVAEAHNNLGVIIRDRDPDEALHHFSEAVRLVPTYAEGLVNLGLLQHRCGRLEEARETLERAIGAHPDHSRAHNSLGLLQQQMGDSEAAIESLERAIATNPADPAPRTNLGNVHLQMARIDRAIECYEGALAIDPQNVEALNNLGGAYRSQRNFAEAIRLFRRALEIRPDYLDALHNLALATPPDLATARENEGILRYAIERNPDDPRYKAVLATALQESGVFGEARELALEVLADDPDHIEAWNVLSVAAINENDHEEALRCCEQVLRRAPDDSTARWNRALSLLALGNYRDGWEAYESRWNLVHFGLDRRHFAEPAWDGSPLDGKTILLYTEQGLGDGIQFVRFSRILKERWNTRIVVQAAPALAPLFRTCSWLDEVVPRGQDLPAFDCHAPLLSLPRLLGIEVDSLDSGAYLEALPRPITGRIAPTTDLKVGLVWGGGTPTPTLAWRSLKLDLLRPLMEIQGVQFYSLQKGDASSELATFAERDRIIDLAGEIDDFTDTAAAIDQLDLVISIDTSVAHLAGALGKPVWILLIHSADWRWFQDREDSPWYASARLFRQSTAGDWASVVERVRDALEVAVADRGRTRPADHRPRALATSEFESAGRACTSVPSIQKLADGRPRFAIDVPIDLLSDPRHFTAMQAELTEQGVDPYLRRFLDDELGSGDVYVDLDAGWGFAALTAATTQARSVSVVAVTATADDESIARNASVTNRLTGSLRIVGAGAAPPAADVLAPPSSFAARSELFLRIAPGQDLAAAVEGAREWIEADRLGVAIWEPPMTAVAERPIQSLLAPLTSLGFAHFRMAVDENGPLLVPFDVHGADGPIFSLSEAFLARNAEANAVSAAERADGNTAGDAFGTAPRLGLDWQIGTNSGWGVYGYNLVRRAIQTGRAMPVLFAAPDIEHLDARHVGHIADALELHRELVRRSAGPGSRFDARFPVLRALGNRLLAGSAGMNVFAPKDVGVVFFEDTHLDADALARGRRFERIVAGSTWNAEVLRGNGLTNVETCIQGIDPSLFHPREPTGRFGDRFVVFSGGKLEYRKGQDIVVAAFREFHRRHPDSLLLFAWHNHWPGTMREITLKGHVQSVPRVAAGGRIDFAAWLRANGLPDGSFVDLGQLPHVAMADAIAEADVGLFPNRCEGGTNLVAMECMAAGVPALLSANTGHLDLIADGASYPLLDQSDVPASRQFVGTEGWGESSIDEIVTTLETAYTDREDARRRGLSGARLLADLSWDNQIDRLFDLLEDLLPTT